MELDVVMPTWNSNMPYFRVVLKRIIDTIPLNKFILVDRYSTDGTVEQVKRMVSPEKLIVIRTHADLARARAIGIKCVGTKFFVFIDSDVLIPRSFRIEKYVKLLEMDSRLGVVSFPIRSIYEYDDMYYNRRGKQVQRILRKIEEITATEIIRHGLFYLIEGDLFLAILRTDIVKDWQPPLYLSAHEVLSLTQHILNKGYLWVEIAEPAIHLKELEYGTGIRRHVKQGLWMGGNARILGIPKKLFFLEIFTRLLLGVPYRILTIRDPVKVLNYASYYIGYLIGYLNPHKYRVWKR